MAYRPTFDCLWCGVAWVTRGPNDLEGWAQLCPDCLGRAGSNPFLRGRLRAALAQRVSVEQASSAAAAAAAHHAAAAPHAAPGPSQAPSMGTVSRPTLYPAFPDDWFLRRGQFQRGAIHDAAWAAELDMVTRWLDGLPLAGRIVEPAAGVGFFSPLLADRGELFAFDADGEALDRARDRLLAHNLRAHLHQADPWAVTSAGGPGARTGAAGGLAGGAPADVVVAAFLVGRVRGAGLDNAAASLRARLGPGGLLAVVDLHQDAAGGPPPGMAWTWHDPALLEAALRRAGFSDLRMAGTGRFFLTASAIAR